MATHLDQNASETGDRALFRDAILQYENVLSMWLRWNDAHDQITARMFESRKDPERIEELLRQADELRSLAVAASKDLLARSHSSTSSDMGRGTRIE